MICSVGGGSVPPDEPVAGLVPVARALRRAGMVLVQQHDGGRPGRGADDGQQHHGGLPAQARPSSPGRRGRGARPRRRGRRPACGRRAIAGRGRVSRTGSRRRRRPGLGRRVVPGREVGRRPLRAAAAAVPRRGAVVPGARPCSRLRRRRRLDGCGVVGAVCAAGAAPQPRRADAGAPRGGRRPRPAGPAADHGRLKASEFSSGTGVRGRAAGREASARPRRARPDRRGRPRAGGGDADTAVGS